MYLLFLLFSLPYTKREYITDGEHVLKYTATPYLKNMGVPYLI